MIPARPYDSRSDIQGSAEPADSGDAATSAAVKTHAAAGSVILFDGVCNLCNASVRFVADRDRGRRFCFAFLQSRSGQVLMRQHGLDDQDLLSSMILIDRGRAFEKSTAALQIARRLDGLWPALFALIVVPRPLRDRIYDFIGRRRYRWFGQTPECQMPRDDLRDRLLP